MTDLDQLERQITEPRAHALTMMDGQTILALIQRLREAETEVKVLRVMDMTATSQQWEGAYLAAKARIAQLEQVLEAAARVVDWWRSTYRLSPEANVVDDLEASLAAVEEK